MLRKDSKIVLAVMFVLFAAIGAYAFGIYRSYQIVRESPVGAIVSASYSDGVTVVETDKGVYLVSGAFQATKGHLLSLAITKGNKRLLCDRVAGIEMELK